MGEPLKTFFSAGLVRRLAADIARVEPSFPARAFVKQASTGLEELELLDRGKHIARALAAHLPADYPEAIDVLLRSLGREHATDELHGVGVAPFFYLPHRALLPSLSSEGENISSAVSNRASRPGRDNLGERAVATGASPVPR